MHWDVSRALESGVRGATQPGLTEAPLPGQGGGLCTHGARGV